ncbi:Pyrroline-5-carboxylate reductase [Apiospora rasikravindrae]|uniref:Pyrroline-5-carboxylate reductase n=1 Tax=Apiospora rasikravindrae TaxID=990691 RepID=A0ABR1TCI8_9PEZI
MTVGLEPTMAIIGCGSLGSAILHRVLETSSEQQVEREPSDSPLPTRFLACVRTSESASRLEDQFAAYNTTKPKRKLVEVWRADRNVEAVRLSTVVILGCQPSQVADVVAEEGMADALRGKLVLNICAGITDAVLWDLLYHPSSSGNGANGAAAHERKRDEYYFVHAMPNAASLVGQSETIVNPRPASFPERYNVLTDWILGSIGHVTELPRELMAAGTVTAGCAVGFFAPVLQGITAGAEAAGLDEDVALRMAAQAMKGAAEMVLAQNKTPQDLIKEVATPGGCTARGLQVLADKQRAGSVATAFETAMKEALARIIELETSSNGNSS